MTTSSEASDEFSDCEYCTHCITESDDAETFCIRKGRTVTEVCDEFAHYENKVRSK